MGSAKALEVLGWLVVILGIIAGIIVINQFGKMEVGWTEKTNPLGIAIGVGIMFEHVILGAFLIVIAHIGQNVYDIKRKLLGEGAVVEVTERSPGPTGGEKTDTTRPTEEEEYFPEQDRPTGNDVLAIRAGKTCHHCKHESFPMFSSKGKCDVFKQKVGADDTCKHFERHQ